MRTKHLSTAFSNTANGPYYRGWSVMLGGFISSMLLVGGALYIFGLFIVPVAEAFQMLRANVNNSLILNILDIVLWPLSVGEVHDRTGSYSAGFTIFAVAVVLFFFLIMAQAAKRWQSTSRENGEVVGTVPVNT